MDNTENFKVNYEPEADVLSWELSGAPIDHAEEAGNMIVHYSENNAPVFIELLNASRFLALSQQLVGKKEVQKAGRIPA